MGHPPPPRNPAPVPPMLSALLLSVFASFPDEPPPAIPDELLTVAEASEFRATATSAEVRALLERIDARSEVMQLDELGRTSEDQSIPLVILADPPVSSAAEARATGKLVVLAFGNIHAGEVCGKEALLMLIREIALAEKHPLLEHLVLLVVPNYNADGNDKMDPNNRRGQHGPERGMGERANGQGLDLNRDWTKLEAPETRAFVALLNEWDPHLVIDTHTTNGSQHRYSLTYAAPQNPAGDGDSLEFVRDQLLPAVGERLLARTGYDTCFYGNFDRAHTRWSTYSADPRFGTNYHGLRGHLAILSEAYAYVSYEERVHATREFVREIFRYSIEHRETVEELHSRARLEAIAAGTAPQPNDLVGLRYRIAAFTRPVELKGYEWTVDEDGRRQRTDTPKTHRVVHLGRFEPTWSVRRPHAYVLEPGLEAIAEKLRQHGITVEAFTGEARVESYEIVALDEARRPFQGHRTRSFEVRAADETRSFPEGSLLVPGGQPLGTLAVHLLEPGGVDSLATWNFLDASLEVGAGYPIHRVNSSLDLP